MKDVLIISENKFGFISKAVETALIKCNLEIESINLEGVNEEEYFKTAAIVMVITGEYLKENVFGLHKIKDACVDNSKMIVLFGTPDDNDSAKEGLGDKLSLKEFIRPMDPNALAKEIVHILEAKKKNDEVKKILIVDDSGMVLRNMMSILEDTYQVALANSASKAESAIEENKPDLILLDYEMPVCSGEELMKRLKSKSTTRDIPIFFLTSMGDADTVRKLLELRPQGYMLKSTPHEELRKRIADFFLAQLE